MRSEQNQHAALTVIAAKAALLLATLLLATMLLAPAQSVAQTTTDQELVNQGRYVFDLAGCEGCHTDKKEKGPRLAGGRKFETDFGTFYSPNITPDKRYGIGKWNAVDFRRAIRHGQNPDGENYFPAFPYPAYAKMTDTDIAALWAYLRVQPANPTPNRAHELSFPFNQRWLVHIWNLINFDPAPLKPEPEKSKSWLRGRYIVEALSHCQQCHTPRDQLGGMDEAMAFAGTPRNPEGITIPNITPDPDTGIGKWSEDDFKMLFTIGMLPDADFVGGVMSEMITHATSRMTEADRAAMTEYLQSLKPVSNRVEQAPKSADQGEEDW